MWLYVNDLDEATAPSLDARERLESAVTRVRRGGAHISGDEYGHIKQEKSAR